MGCGLAGDGLMGGERVSDGLASRNQRYRVLRLMWWCWAIAASEAPGCLHVSTMWVFECLAVLATLCAGWGEGKGVHGVCLL